MIKVWALKEDLLVRAFVLLHLRRGGVTIWKACRELLSWMPYRSPESIYSKFQREKKRLK